MEPSRYFVGLEIPPAVGKFRVFSPDSELLGEITEGNIAGGSDFGPFIGFEVTNEDGIGQVQIDYGDSGQGVSRDVGS